MDKQKNKYYYLKGIKNGMPICLGYLAVSFTLGITARNAGMTAWQAMLTSLACNASADSMPDLRLSPPVDLILK